jgi:uncharacterized protein (TIGR04255 family)
LQEELRHRYPKVDVKKKFQAEFRIEAGKLVTPRQQDLGFLGTFLATDDGSMIAQFRADGFTLNNVVNYVGGDRLLDEALELWDRYAAIARPAAVSRVALRFLNRLELPLEQGQEFSRYLTTRIELPQGVPQMVSSFVNRVVSHDETGATVIVTQKLDRPTMPLPVIIDVDGFFEREFEISGSELGPALQTLRALKNRCFFALLTNEAVKMYA